MALILVPCLSCRAGTPAAEEASSVSCAGCGMALPPPGEAAWLMTRSGSDQYGPYTLAQLAAYIAERRILPADGIWPHGATVRLNANQLPAFGAVAAPAPAPAPVVPAPPPAPVTVAPAASAPVDAAPADVAPSAPAPVEPAPPAEQPLAEVTPAPVSPAPAAAPVYAAPVAYVPPQGNRAALHLKRAFNWDLRSLPVEPDEEATLIANGVDEPDARRYLVWRRSVLLVVAVATMVSALLKTIGVATDSYAGFTALGVMAALAVLLPLYAMPLTAWLAAKVWDQHRRSRTILMRGWLFAFLTPLLLALIPYTWRVDLSTVNPLQQGQVAMVLNLGGAMLVYVTLMPAVLALIPGVLRACLRIKALIPESILPGLFLVAATPLYILLFLVIFTTVNQIAGNGMLILGVIALVGAPMLYLVNGRLFTRPLRTEEEIARIGSVQNFVLVVMGIGLALIVAYAFTAEIFNRSLVGTDPQTSAIRPWDPQLIQFPIEYFVRSLFTTVLVADLFMMMNLQLWKHSREFQATAEAEAYDRLMIEIEEAGYAPVPQPQPPQPTA